jgi:hypothetical protein
MKLKTLATTILILTLSITLIGCGATDTENKTVQSENVGTDEIESSNSISDATNEEVETAANNNENTDTSTEKGSKTVVDTITSIFNTDKSELSGSCGENAEYYYKDNTLVITGTGEITENPWIEATSETVNSNDNNNSSYDLSEVYTEADGFEIKTIIIEDGITSISCDNAFINLTHLENVTLSDSLEYIGKYAFSNCYNLTEIVIPNNVTKLGHSAFLNCNSLEKVQLSTSLTNINPSTFSCTSIEEITIPESVKSISTQAFFACTYLRKVNLENESISIGTSAFDLCIDLEDINISDNTIIADNAFGINSLSDETRNKILSINENAIGY